MTGAQQISLRLRTVFVSAGWLPRTEVMERSPTRRRLGMKHCRYGPKCESRDGGRSILGSNLTPTATSYHFLFLNLPYFILEACNLWICGGSHLKEVVHYILNFLR